MGSKESCNNLKTMTTSGEDFNQPPFEFRWAQRVRPEKIRRLYELEAQGLVDEDLLNDVFYAINDRCQSILTCTEAADGRVKCQRCGAILLRQDLNNRPESKAEVILCPNCSWKTTWGEFLESYQGKQLFAGGTGPALHHFVDLALKAKTPREKMLMIDVIIHAYHWEMLNTPTRPTAMNLIAGNNEVVIDLLLGLAYQEGDDELLKTKTAWVEKTRSADERRKGTLYGGKLSKLKDENKTP